MTLSNEDFNQQDSNDDMPTLSCCMIVKNEEKFLAQCLDSIKDVVDEIIIVDTGSTDNTVEIAKQYTDKVYFHEWQNSFSEARNYSLQFATCDWILQIDADEELEQEDIPMLYKALKAADKKEDVNAIFVALYNELSSGESKHYFQRIFRRGKAHYEGIVHNQLIYEGKAMATEIKFRHYGYNLSQEGMAKKHERTGNLLRQQIEENPTNTFARMNLVRIYRNQRNFDKAIETAKTALELYSDKMTPYQRQMIKCDMANCMIQAGQHDSAEKVCLQVLEENPNNLDVTFALALVYQMTGRYQSAISRYRQFLMTQRDEKRHTRFNLLIVDTYTSSDKAWNNMGLCYQKTGQLDSAINAYQKAVEENPESNVFYKNLSHVYLQKGEIDKARNVLEEAVGLDIADYTVYFRLGDIHLRKGELRFALEDYQKVIELNPNNISAYNRLGKVFLQMGNLEQAENWLERVVNLAPEFGKNKKVDSLLVDTLINLANIKTKTGKKKESLEIIDQISKFNLSDENIYLNLANLCVELEEYKKAIGIFESYLKSNPTDSKALTDLATCYAEIGNYRSAMIGYKASLKMNPTNIQAMKNLKALEGKISEMER